MWVGVYVSNRAEEGPWEVIHAMAPTFDPDDDDATIAAKILKSLDRGGYYEPKKMSLDGLPDKTPVASHEEGDVVPIAEELVADETFPLKWVEHGRTVALEVDSQQWTAASIARLDEEQLEWTHKERLGRM